METSIAHGIDMTGKKAAYDTNVKRLLAEKIILAHILLGTVPEFAGMEPEEIVPLIEGEPDIEETSAYPEETNMGEITGLRNEDAVPNEGNKMRYDLLEAIMVCLSEDIASGDGLRLHGLLGILFSSKLSVSEKKSMLEKEYIFL